MALGFDQLVSKLQVRFDYQSSRSVAREALTRAGLKEQDHYSAEELQKFVDGLNAVSKNLARVWTSIGLAPSGEPLPPPPAPKVEVKAPEPPKPEPKPAPAPVVEAAPEPTPEPTPEPEPVVEAAPEPTQEASSEAAPPDAEQATEAAPEADSWGSSGKKNKKNKNKNRDESQSEASPDGETPAEG